MIDARKIGVLSDGGEVYQVVAPLHDQVRKFDELGVAYPYLVDVAKTAQIRLEGISNDWTRTSIVPLSVKGGRTILRRKSPLMSLAIAESAVKANQSGKYLSLPLDVYESAEAIAKSQEGLEPEDREAVILSFDGDSQLSSSGVETAFLLGNDAAQYFERFVPRGEIPFFNLTGDSKKETSVNYLGFVGPRGDSGLDCWGAVLGGACGAFGVLYSGAASAKNLGYTLSQISKANSEVIPKVLESQGFSGATDKVSRPLNKGLVDRLRGR